MLKKVLLFCLVLCLPSLTFGQAFKGVIDSTQYPSTSNNAIIPIHPNQAILAWKRVPRNGTIVDVNIIPSVSFRAGGLSPIAGGAFGWDYYSGEVSSPGSFDIYYTVIDSETFYGRTAVLSPQAYTDIQNILVSKNLGTVAQRAALIRGFHSGPVQILDIDNFKKSILNALSPFLNIYLGIFLTLFVVDLMSRKSKDVIAESAKIQRRAERAQQRREMRADPTAQIFEFRLANFSSIASGSVSDPSISRRKARRLFEDTAMEYAEYKKSRGWKY